ncbi:MAG: phenylpyruvate tautomerase MIF-related protein [Ethanoligenens sp.]|uniref:phenylpyruvate tautomerase MIF-related protein n=1 Tax=Ethanoligenens sp. TaxID=2099655 RepID=UPI0039E9A46A
MPFIQVKTTVKLTPVQEDLLKAKFGVAIELLPGKSENWLMVAFEGNSHMYFKGKCKPDIAFVEVKLFGKAGKQDYIKLTRELSGILHEELGLDPTQIYIKYEEVTHWGWNGNNF